jgi:hypothetical protein
MIIELIDVLPAPLRVLEQTPQPLLERPRTESQDRRDELLDGQGERG